MNTNNQDAQRSPDETAVIVGVGNGVSTSLARRLHKEGYGLILAARDIEKLTALQKETNATLHTCDISKPEQVKALFDTIKSRIGVVICNPSMQARGKFVDLDPAEVEQAIKVTALGSFLVAQQAAARMLEQSASNHCKGTILLTGATAGVKGFAQSAAFAMGKFAQRGLSQSMSRELHPQGIHVCWINIDGMIRNEHRDRAEPSDKPASMLDPDAIADTYLSIVHQHPSAWSEEIAIRPWVETF